MFQDAPACRLSKLTANRGFIFADLNRANADIGKPELKTARMGLPRRNLAAGVHRCIMVSIPLGGGAPEKARRRTERRATGSVAGRFTSVGPNGESKRGQEPKWTSFDRISNLKRGPRVPHLP